MDYKPDPEFFINVDLADGKVVQIHAKHIKKIAEWPKCIEISTDNRDERDAGVDSRTNTNISPDTKTK